MSVITGRGQPLSDKSELPCKEAGSSLKMPGSCPGLPTPSRCPVACPHLLDLLLLAAVLPVVGHNEGGVSPAQGQLHAGLVILVSLHYLCTLQLQLLRCPLPRVPGHHSDPKCPIFQERPGH